MLDTGFNGYLTLPQTLIEELDLPVMGDGAAVLADGSEAAFNVYGVTVLWDDQPLQVETGAIGVDALLGMAMLDGYNLNVDVKTGGHVVIQPGA